MALLAAGCELEKILGLDSRGELLVRWKAHYCTEQLYQAACGSSVKARAVALGRVERLLPEVIGGARQRADAASLSRWVGLLLGRKRAPLP